MTILRPSSFLLLGTTLGIESDDPTMGATLGELWRPFATTVAAPEADLVSIRRRGDGWKLLGFRGHKAESSDPWEIAEQACSALFQESIRRAARIVDLHAGVVTRERATLLLIAGTGTGKTTLTLELLAAGWRYVSDDLAPIDQGTAEIRAFPKPASVKDIARFDELVRSVPEAWPPPQRAFPAHIETTVAPDERLRPDAVLFIERGGHETTMRSISASEATLRCGRFVSRDNMTPAGLHALARLCTNARTGELRYREASEARVALKAFVNEI